jgi:outer membrane protein assembly factor BamD
MKCFRILLPVFVAMAVASGCASLKPESARDDWPVTKFYSEATHALSKKRWELALDLYQALEARYPYGPYADQAHIDTIYAYYKKGEPETAIAAADRFLRLHPTHPGIAYAYYMKGLVNFNEQRNFYDRWVGIKDVSDRDPRAARESFLAFRELVSRYPDSPYTENARQRMKHLLNVLAMSDINVAEYYFRRGAYVAVVNRCKNVIEEYQQTFAVEDALGLMAVAYQRMGMNELAQDSLRVLKINFPQSEYIPQIDSGQYATQKESWMSRMFKQRPDDS